MQLKLKGKKALVTGSSKGIGLSIAKRLLKEGCLVAINGRNPKRLQTAKNELNNKNVICISGDTSNPSSAVKIINDTINSLGSLDILVCNVGSGASVPPGEESFEEWQRVFSINLWSTTNMVEAAKNELEKENGVVVCISSICGYEVIPGAPVTYSVAKAALNSYVKGISRPLGKVGIRINCVVPGNILFGGSVWQNKIKENESLVKEMLENEVPLSCFGDTNEVSNIVAFLVSDQSKFVNGANWIVDGGQTRS